MSNTNEFWNDEKVSELLKNVTSYVAPEHWNKVIEDFKKLKEVKRSLSTDDGKEIFEGDVYWAVDKKTFKYGRIIASDRTYLNGKIRTIYFSTEDAAKEYVLKNKPFSISYQELMNRLHDYFKNPVMASENILHLSKEKLNQ